MAKKKTQRRSGVDTGAASPPAEEFAGSDGARTGKAGAVSPKRQVVVKTDKTEQRAYRRNRPPSGA